MRIRAGRIARNGVNMAADLWLGGLVAALLMGYLVYALVRPEKF